HPVTRGTAQNPDIYFQAREASNIFYEQIVETVKFYLSQVGELTGRPHGLFDYYGAPDATAIIVAMGSVTQTIEETVDYLNAQGAKYGVLEVHLYRPFSMKDFLGQIPTSVTRIAVLDRTKEPGALGEPLYLDVRHCYYDEDITPIIIGGRYGLGSKDTTPADIKAVYDNLVAEKPKNHFTVGIVDDVTHTSLAKIEKIDTAPKGSVQCKFWGLGSDGTVGANKQAIKIIGNHTNKYVQAYFDYDSKKSGGLTVSHLRFGDVPIKSTYLVDEADYVACHNQSYIYQYDLVKGLKEGGTFVLNCRWDNDQLDEMLPASLKSEMANKAIKLYTIDAIKIAEEVGLGN
ncbi:MAG: 2-oxoacid:acceptor oxidoreductase family protein, partial [Niameybacter sp.]